MTNQIKVSYGPKGYGGSNGYSLYRFAPWALSHIQNISETVQGTSATIGIPNRPASDVQIFDTTGAYRVITISGVRLDSEEYISNVDFIYNELNLQNVSESGSYTTYTYQVGLSWLVSNLQVAKAGYTLTFSQDECDNTFIMGTAGAPASETINVAQGNLTFEFSGDTPGLLSYTLTLTEKRSTGTNVYRPTNAFPTS